MPTRSLLHNVKPASPAARRARGFLLHLDGAAEEDTTTAAFSPPESDCRRNDTTTPCGPLDRVMRVEPPAVRAEIASLARHAEDGRGRALDFGEDGAPLVC